MLGNRECRVRWFRPMRYSILRGKKNNTWDHPRGLKEDIKYSPVTNASMNENAATDNSCGPSRPATTIDTVCKEFCKM